MRRAAIVLSAAIVAAVLAGAGGCAAPGYDSVRSPAGGDSRRSAWG